MAAAGGGSQSRGQPEHEVDPGSDQPVLVDVGRVVTSDLAPQPPGGDGADGDGADGLAVVVGQLSRLDLAPEVAAHPAGGRLVDLSFHQWAEAGELVALLQPEP